MCWLVANVGSEACVGFDLDENPGGEDSSVIGLGHRPSHADHVVAQDISGTLTLFRIPSGHHYRCYNLNELGGRVWALCDGARTVLEIVEAIRQEYEVPADRVRADVMALLQELAEEHLVDVGDQPASGR